MEFQLIPRISWIKGIRNTKVSLGDFKNYLQSSV